MLRSKVALAKFIPNMVPVRLIGETGGRVRFWSSVNLTKLRVAEAREDAQQARAVPRLLALADDLDDDVDADDVESLFGEGDIDADDDIAPPFDEDDGFDPDAAEPAEGQPGMHSWAMFSLEYVHYIVVVAFCAV